MNSELLLRTLFACMACDGEIAPEEVELFNVFIKENNIATDCNDQISGFINSLNENSKSFFSKLLEDIDNANLSEEEELKLISMIIKVIESDNKVEYSEIKFLKLIKSHFHVSNEVILEHNPDKEDYIAEDTKSIDYLGDYLNVIDWTEIQFVDLSDTNY